MAFFPQIFRYTLPLLCWCCTQAFVHHSELALPSGHWQVDHLVSFSFSIVEAEQPYTIEVVIDSTLDYPYQNLYLTFYLEGEKQVCLQQSLKAYELFELTTGQPLGSGWGASKRIHGLLVQNFIFPKPGVYRIRLEHFMRTEVLQGVAKLGIYVYPTSTK